MPEPQPPYTTLASVVKNLEKKGYVRSIDVANQLGVSKPSVSYATKRLRENGYISFNEDGMINLTDSGMEVAEKIYTRHKVLTDFFIKLGVDPEVASEDACGIEHDISSESFEKLCNFVNSCGVLQENCDTCAKDCKTKK